MDLTSFCVTFCVFLGSIYLSSSSHYIEIDANDFQHVTLNEKDSTTLECRAGVNHTAPVYWLSVRYRRFISKNDVLFDYGANWDNFGISVDAVEGIYNLHIYQASVEVNGIYVCYTSALGSRDAFWAGEVTVLPGYYLSSAVESLSGDSMEPKPDPTLDCSASYIPPMMDMININDVEMELRCAWSGFDHPDLTPTLFCNGTEVLSKYFIGETVMARVMLKDYRECINFSCVLKGSRMSRFKETCKYVQKRPSGIAEAIREGARVDPMYSVIQQGMDAMFVCLSGSGAEQGTFQWNVSSRLFDTADIMKSMEVTQTSKASTMLIKNVQVVTDEPLLVMCTFREKNATEDAVSEALLTVIANIADSSNKTKKTPEAMKSYQMQTTVLILVALVFILLGITLCLIVYVCKRKARNSGVESPNTEGSNNNENRKFSTQMYVSMKGIWNRNVTTRAKLPTPACSLSKPDIALKPARTRNRSGDLHIQQNVAGKLDTPPRKSNPAICIDDNEYIVPDSDQGGSTPIVLRAKNPRRMIEGPYSSTDVLVGSRELSARSSQADLTDRDGYLVPSMVVEQGLEDYVYATSDVSGGSGTTAEQRKSASCHELSNYTYA